jgi:hypothetical protein
LPPIPVGINDLDELSLAKQNVLRSVEPVKWRGYVLAGSPIFSERSYLGRGDPGNILGHTPGNNNLISMMSGTLHCIQKKIV